jgi:hypothetical protein
MLDERVKNMTEELQKLRQAENRTPPLPRNIT